MVAAAPTRLCCPQGEFELTRYPGRKQDPLQAWCSADMLLLEAAGNGKRNVLVVNDDHGALAVALSPCGSWTDSALSVTAGQLNCEQNRRSYPSVTWSTQAPGDAYEHIFMRVPKLLSYFEYQLATLAATLPANARLYIAGMDKHLSPRTASLIETYFAQVRRHRGKHKARLFTAVSTGQTLHRQRDGERRYHCAELGGELTAGPNVFSGDQLDIGSRFLLQQLGSLDPVETAADLACGNGVLGIAALKQGVAREVLFADESAMAIASAHHNCATLVAGANTCFHHGDGLIGTGRRFDLILCNPPFHLGHTVDEYAGRRLLGQAAEHLLPGGCLVLVANRHLDYGSGLRRGFRTVEKLAQNNKFIVWLAQPGC